MHDQNTHHTQNGIFSHFRFLVLSLLVGFCGGLFAFFVSLYAWGALGEYTSWTEHIERQILINEEQGIIELVEKTNPSVVSIVIEKEIQQSRGFVPSPFFDDFFGALPPFFFDEGNPTHSPSEPQLRRVGGGSGFIVSEDGLIVTNKHVISDDAARYTVVLSDGREFVAEVVARDPTLDIGLIRITESGLPTLTLGDSDTLRMGQSVVAIGYALAEFGNTVTKGVVSGIGRRVTAGNGRGMSEVLDEAIQTDAAINPGNSGGPLLDLNGNVVGINTAVSREGQLVGFAIPINHARKTIESVQREGRIVRPWIGVRYIPVTSRLVASNNLMVEYGVLVSRGATIDDLAVIPGSPADKAGIVENDIILEIDGIRLDENDSFARIVGRYDVGDRVRLKVLHREEEREVDVVLEEFPDLSK